VDVNHVQQGSDHWQLAVGPGLGHQTLNERKGLAMDYGKSGNPKMSKDLSRQVDPNVKGKKELKAKGSTKANPRATPTKEELLARLKAAAEAKPKD
jgi:hypothetical protein